MFFGRGKFSFFALGLLTAFLIGCFPVVIPEVTETTWTIDSETIEPIVSGQPIPKRIRWLKGDKINVTFKEDLCMCNGIRNLNLSVSEVNTNGLQGYRFLSGRIGMYGNWYWNSSVGDLNWYWNSSVEDFEKTCAPFIDASNAIKDARRLSKRGDYYFLDSFELSWEAERVLGPLECDPVRSLTLAEKARELAIEEGAKILGFDISGDYGSEISGNHPVITMLRELSNGPNPKIVIRQDGKIITGTDSSGRGVLAGVRPDNRFRTDVKFEFKFSYPQTIAGEIEGEWVLNDETSELEGTWHDPVSKASGKWVLYRFDHIEKAKKLKSMARQMEKFISHQSAVEIKWDAIEKIVVPTKDWDWHACIIGPPGTIGICIPEED
jgi:hypothetical protein